MNSLSFHIARRYIRGTSMEKNIARMVKVSFLSIFIGSFALALMSAIMRGFEHATHEKMQSIHAPITIRAYHDEPLDYEALASTLENEFPVVQAFGPMSTHQVIVQAENSDDITNIIALKGISPDKEALITSLNQKIISTVHGNNALGDALQGNHILIGNKLAQSLNVKIGDTIKILFTRDEESRSRRITLNTAQARIGGIFNTGIEEFDAGLALSHIDYFDTIFPDSGIIAVDLKLQPNSNEDAVITALKKRLNLDVYSWKDLYPALVAALKLEKIAMFLILTLIIIVATMNIISLLFMQITQKRGDIAILKAMGLSDLACRTIFMYMGMGISCIACSAGLLCATVASYLLEHYPFISLPDAYYVSHVPARMELSSLLLVFAVIMTIAFVITWLTANSIRKINISQVLRFEA